MSVQNGFAASLPRPSVHTIAVVALRLAIQLVTLAALLFLPAGRWNWPEAWAVLVAYGGFKVLCAIWELCKDPALFRERRRVASNVKTWDKPIVMASTLCRALTVVIAGLDAGRFHWSSVPLSVEVLGWLGQAVAVAVLLWAGATNTYLSRFARIQNDRGHTVVTSGPYGYVRHPMYLGIIVLFLCIPLALGSWRALLPGAAIAVLIVIRARLEDSMLRRELVGYEAYARHVRYRLLRGVW
jgi:protein-S-isoprenylcysteine O-methyltransferase Ste14